MKHHTVCYRNFWVCSQPSKETWLDVLTCSTTYVAFLLKQHINAFVNVVLSIHRQTIRSVLSPMLVQTTCKVLQRVLVPDILCWLMLFLRFSIYIVAKEFVWDWNNYFLSFNQYLFLFLWFFFSFFVYFQHDFHSTWSSKYTMFSNFSGYNMYP